MQNPQPTDANWLNRLSYVFTSWVLLDAGSSPQPTVPARYKALHQAYLDAVAPLINATKQMTTAEQYLAGKTKVIDLSGVDLNALAAVVSDARSKFAAYDVLLNAARKAAGLPPLVATAKAG
jgi:hypothetical protein